MVKADKAQVVLPLQKQQASFTATRLNSTTTQGDA